MNDEITILKDKIKVIENEIDLLKLENTGHRKEIALTKDNCLLVIIDQIFFLN